MIGSKCVSENTELGVLYLLAKCLWPFFLNQTNKHMFDLLEISVDKDHKTLLGKLIERPFLFSDSSVPHTES